jgi:hypothetical protein
LVFVDCGYSAKAMYCKIERQLLYIFPPQQGHRMKANFRGTTRRACITAAVGLITDCGVIR